MFHNLSVLSRLPVTRKLLLCLRDGGGRRGEKRKKKERERVRGEEVDYVHTLTMIMQ